MPGLTAILTLVFFLPTLVSSYAEAASSVNIRPFADGAGPSHIFWLNGPPAGQPGADIVGIIDPLYSAIRFFSISRAENGNLRERTEEMGACALRIDFLPWRVHQFKKFVIIEGMPRPGPEGQNAIEKSFKSAVLSIARTLLAGDGGSAAQLAGSRIETADWDPSGGPDCGNYMASEMRAGDVASYTARRGNSQPKRTIILTNKIDALAPNYPLTVRVRTGGQYWLYSAVELEPAGATRIVQTAQADDGNDGLVRIRQRLLVFNGIGSKLQHEVLFDESLLRSKLGYKPLAVLPSGEILVMGRFGNNDSFSIRSCGPVFSLGHDVCPQLQEGVQAHSDLEPANIQSSALDRSTPSLHVDSFHNLAPNANAIFATMRPYSNKSWSVDASRLPKQCRVPSGCAVDGQATNFVPLRGIRLSRQTFTRVGAPYAQTDDLTDVRKFLEVSDRDLTSALEHITTGVPGAPGNLNDDYDGEIGIDCSALLQIAWSGAEAGRRLSTSLLQRRKHISYRCDNRVPNASALKPGDAIGLYVSPGVSHVVLYAAELKFDGASTSWLVLESSSICDGVCWSIYDPAFFNGWGIYRAAWRRDLACPASARATSIELSPIPEAADAWRVMLNR